MYTITRSFFRKVCYKLPPELCEMIRAYYREYRLQFLYKDRAKTIVTVKEIRNGKECIVTTGHYQCIFLRKYNSRRRKIVKFQYERIFSEKFEDNFVDIFTISRCHPHYHDSSLLSIAMNIGNRKIFGNIHRFTWMPYVPFAASITSFFQTFNIPENENEVLNYMHTFRDNEIPEQHSDYEWPYYGSEPVFLDFEHQDSEIDEETTLAGRLTPTMRIIPQDMYETVHSPIFSDAPTPPNSPIDF